MSANLGEEYAAVRCALCAGTFRESKGRHGAVIVLVLAVAFGGHLFGEDAAKCERADNVALAESVGGAAVPEGDSLSFG